MSVGNAFMPRPGRFGTLPVPLTSGRINTGTLAAGTQNHNIGAMAATCVVSRATICAEVFPTAATSCTLQLFKMTGVTALALTAAVDINAKTADTPIQVAVTGTLTDAQRTLLPGDSLRVAIVTVGAVSVQPDDLTTVVELLVQD
jgi:hypothetical protein